MTKQSECGSSISPPTAHAVYSAVTSLTTLSSSALATAVPVPSASKSTNGQVVFLPGAASYADLLLRVRVWWARPPPSSSLSAVVLDNADMCGLVASCLCRNTLVGSNIDNRLVELVRCRRSQRLARRVVVEAAVSVRQALPTPRPVEPMEPACRVRRSLSAASGRLRRSTAEVLRRLLGAEVSAREVAGRMGEQRTVDRIRHAWYELRSVGLTQRRHQCVEPPPPFGEQSKTAYAQLTPALFDRLTLYLLEPSRRYIVEGRVERTGNGAVPSQNKLRARCCCADDERTNRRQVARIAAYDWRSTRSGKRPCDAWWRSMAQGSSWLGCWRGATPYRGGCTRRRE